MMKRLVQKKNIYIVNEKDVDNINGLQILRDDDTVETTAFTFNLCTIAFVSICP